MPRVTRSQTRASRDKETSNKKRKQTLKTLAKEAVVMTKYLKQNKKSQKKLKKDISTTESSIKKCKKNTKTKTKKGRKNNTFNDKYFPNIPSDLANIITEYTNEVDGTEEIFKRHELIMFAKHDDTYHKQSPKGRLGKIINVKKLMGGGKSYTIAYVDFDMNIRVLYNVLPNVIIKLPSYIKIHIQDLKKYGVKSNQARAWVIQTHSELLAKYTNTGNII